jgi:hypothetical protein
VSATERPWKARESERHPGVWYVEGGHIDWLVAEVEGQGSQDADNAALIVRAANAHDALYEALEWALDYIADGAVEDDIPRHACEYYHNPEKGTCDFCDHYADARAALSAARPAPTTTEVEDA